MFRPHWCSLARASFAEIRSLAPVMLRAGLVCGLLGFSLSGLAQTPQQISEAARAAERIQQEQQERQRQQLIEDARKRKETAPITLPQVPAPAFPALGACRDIREIVLTGVTRLSVDEQQSLTRPYLNRCLPAADIERLLGEIIKAYMDRGHIAVRPYIRAQDPNGGRLEILVVEGKVESILLQDGDRKSLNLGTAFPGVVGQPLNLRDIEQGMDQVNRLASNSATMEILPGTAPGDSIVSITNEPAFPIGFTPTLDNLGSASTGVNQLGGTLNVNNPLSLNDFFSYTRKESMAPNRDTQLSLMDSAYYSVPFGYALLSLSYSASSYLTPVRLASGTTLKSTGNSGSVTAKLDWVGYRDQVQKLTESMAVTQKSSKNYLASQLLEVSSRNLTILDLDLQWTRFIAAGAVNLGIGYSKGLAMMGALNDAPDIAAEAPHAQGEKIRYSAGLSLPFKVGGTDASFSSQFSGQYARQALYGSEQMLIGSYYTVRGFVKNSLSGDRAYYLRNELALSVPSPVFPNVMLKPYVGLDIGRVEAYASTPAGGLAGAALGVRINSRKFNGDISLVQAVHTPQNMVKERAQILATLSLNF